MLNIGNHRGGGGARRWCACWRQGWVGGDDAVDAPRPAVDVEETFASVDAIGALTGFRPSVGLAEGIPRFVAWFRTWHGLA